MLSKQFPVRLENDPMHVVLSKQGQSWDEDVQIGRDKDEMIKRLASTDVVTQKPKDETYQGKWKDRTHGKKLKPRYVELGVKEGKKHIPIIMQEGEFVRFQGPAPFLVLLIPEPEVAPGLNATANPFVGVMNVNVPFSEYSTLDPATGLNFVQCQVRRGDDVTNQLFFKMIFIVIDDGKPYLVDPDFFCDK